MLIKINKNSYNRNIYISEEDKNLKTNNYNIIKRKKNNSLKKTSGFSILNKLIMPISLFLIFILIFLIVSVINSYKNNRTNNNINNNINDNINVNETETEVQKLNNTRKRLPREEALKRGKNFMNKCLQGLLFNHQTFTKSNEPKITAIVPVYNSQNIVKSAIRSIQNQLMTDIEIILVNDFSTDNSSQIIEEMRNEDPRIKIINNEKNMGILYSRCIAVLEAKGKYILNLDQDDFFLDEDLFDALYEEAEDGNFDIVSFMDLEINNYDVNINQMNDGPCTHHPDNLIVRQPELPYYPMFKNDHFDYVDIQIWGKIFKTEVYKKAVNLLGKERYSTYNAINEDIVGVFSICIVAESYKYMRKYGLFHLVGHLTAVHRATGEHTSKMIIFLSDIIYDLSKNEYKKYAAIMILELRVFNDEIKQNLRNFLKKVMNCEYIEEKYKEKIRKKFSELGVLN